VAAIVGAKNPKFENRNHFFSAAAEAMRRILIDRARRKLTQRHGGGVKRVDLDGQDLAAPDTDEQLLAVHEVLDKFAKDHPVQAEVVKLRYFVGMTNEETAKALDISVATVKNYWTFARTWISSKSKTCNRFYSSCNFRVSPFFPNSRMYICWAIRPQERAAAGKMTSQAINTNKPI